MSTALEALDRTLRLCRDFVSLDRASDDALASALLDTRTCIVADEANLASSSGQSALVALVGQLAMLGCNIKLVMPEVDIIGHQPPLIGRELRSALLEYSGDVIPGRAGALAAGSDERDLVFVLGDSSWNGSAQHAWRLAGTRWAGRTAPAAESSSRWAADLPLGGLSAALIAAAEAFKWTLRRFSANEALMLVPSAAVRLAQESLCSSPLDLGAIDCISAGAITSSMLYALLRMPGITGKLRMIDLDHFEIHNLNRYPLLRHSLLGQLKAEGITRWQQDALSIVGLAGRLAPTTAHVLNLAPRVVVGADNVRARWNAQSLWPEWLGVGATSHFLAVTSDHLPGEACAGCLHHVDDGDVSIIPTVGFVSAWAGLSLASRLLRFIDGARGAEAEQVDELATLRLDGRLAQWRHPTIARVACPIQCRAPKRLRAG